MTNIDANIYIYMRAYVSVYIHTHTHTCTSTYIDIYTKICKMEKSEETFLFSCCFVLISLIKKKYVRFKLLRTIDLRYSIDRQASSDRS